MVSTGEMYKYLAWAFEIIKTNTEIPESRIKEIKKAVRLAIKKNLPAPAAINPKKMILFINPTRVTEIVEEMSEENAEMSKEEIEEFVMMFAMIHELYHPLYDVVYYEESAKKIALSEITKQVKDEECLKMAYQIAERIAAVVNNIFHDALINERVIGTLFQYYRINYGIEAAVAVVNLYKKAMYDFVFKTSLPWFIKRDFGAFLKKDANIDEILKPVMESSDIMMKYKILESMELLIKSIDFNKLCNTTIEKCDPTKQKCIPEPGDVDDNLEPDEILPEKEGKGEKPPSKPPKPSTAKGRGAFGNPLDILEYMSKEPDFVRSMDLEGIDLRLMINGLRKFETEITPLRFTPKDIIMKRVFSKRLKTKVPKMYAQIKKPSGAIFIVVDVSGSIFTEEYIKTMVSIAKKLMSERIDVYFVPFHDSAVVVKPDELEKNFGAILKALLERGGGGTVLSSAIEKIKETIHEERLRPPFSILIFSDYEVEHSESAVPPGSGWLFAAGVNTSEDAVRSYVDLVRSVNPGYKVTGYLMDPVKSTRKKAVFVKCC